MIENTEKFLNCRSLRDKNKDQNLFFLAKVWHILRRKVNN